MYITIMAGGSGTRFWPASRESLPKQFLNITGPRPLIEETFLRVAPLTEEEKIFLVINRAHESLVRDLFAHRRVTVLSEPLGRNTAPCIGLAALHVRRRAGNAVMAALPADHFIYDDEAFRQAVRAAAQLVRQGGIATLGVTPTRPETGYGYLLKGPELTTILSHPVHRLEQFVEKPDLETARRYVLSKKYLWNSGIFVFTAETILEEIGKYLPKLYAALERLDRSLDRGCYDDVLAEVYPTVEAISIDYGVMEKTRAPVYVLPVHFGWNDVGSWQAVYDLRATDHDPFGNLVQGDGLLVDVHHSLIYSRTERLIAVLGLENVMIIDTDDVLLVGDLRRSQEVRRFPEQLKSQGRGTFC